MFNSKGKFLTLVLAVVMVFGSFTLMVQATPEGDVGHDFDQMLEQMRSEFFSPIRPAMDLGLEQVSIDDSDIIHMPQMHVTPEYDGFVGITPFSPQLYVEGSTRLFNAMVSPVAGSEFFSMVQGNLVRQGNHVNIWVLDPDAYAATVNLAGNPGRANQDRLAAVSENTALLDEIVERFDDIYARMTQDFAPFEGVRIATPYSNMPFVGDVNQDGRINVLLYNIDGKSSPNDRFIAGFYTDADFFTNNGHVPIALLHMDIARDFGYRRVTSEAAVENLVFYNMFAHEFQHLLFYMYFGVYTQNPAFPTPNRYLWFNESLSELAGKFWAREGTEVILSERLINAAGNSYSGNGVGDFVNFNRSAKNIGMSMLHSTLMHRHTAGAYVSAIYDYFQTLLPPAATIDQFNANRNQLQTSTMPNTIGNAFNAAGLMGSTSATGEMAFSLIYFLFMENFAADGGDIVAGSTTHTTAKFINSPASARNLWGVRPSLGTPNLVSRDGMVGVGAFYDLSTRPALPMLSSGGNFSISAFTNFGLTPQNSTLDRMFRLIGESGENPVLTISVNDNHPNTQFYVVIPNDTPGTVASAMNPEFGRYGATVYPIARNNAVNIIDTGGQTAYLFVVTLFRNVPSTTVTYGWGSDTGPTPTPTPTPVDGVTSWAELRAAVNAAPEGVPIVIPINNCFAAPLVTGTWGVGNAIEISRNRHITLVSSNIMEDTANVRILTQENSIWTHFVVFGESSLTLCQNITLSGGEANNTNNSGGVQVLHGGEFIMNSGSVIENCHRHGTRTISAVALTPGGNPGTGGGTSVARFTMTGGTIRYNSGETAGGVNAQIGQFVMTGGTIYNNTGTTPVSAGGVNIGRFAQFTMTGGTIHGNTGAGAVPTGGVRLYHDASFTMYGGEISGHSDTAVTVHGRHSHGFGGPATFTMNGGSISNNSSSGVAGLGSGSNLPGTGFITMNNGSINNNGRNGVSVSASGTFTMNNGSINYNAGAGVFLAGESSFTMNNGSINNNSDSGVWVSALWSTFTMYGGLIDGNINTSDRGAGVHLHGGTFTMEGGVISNNIQSVWGGGGGIRVMGGVFNMTHYSARIENNQAVSTAANLGGGGILIDFGTVNITAGTITGNSAARGGGVFVGTRPREISILNMTGGSITNNVATYNGGGIYSTEARHTLIFPSGGFNNLNIGPGVIFSGNTAGNGWSAPPYDRLSHIAATTASIWDYVLNNYDINYTGRLGQEP